ncbi:hypothetical protein CBL_06474 [Carabus blaptoides fortunei]
MSSTFNLVDNGLSTLYASGTQTRPSTIVSLRTVGTVNKCHLARKSTTILIHFTVSLIPFTGNGVGDVCCFCVPSHRRTGSRFRHFPLLVHRITESAITDVVPVYVSTSMLTHQSSIDPPSARGPGFCVLFALCLSNVHQ